ncbi:4-(cytidine 5'-diphospho)-2-C-methyl-D-erythritol kinase [Fulvivirgaceae bacterium BMA12]|uniref:4-diphosphocytidyl-2-C-methyl-D-erythritol kinase n=1 Tax=Agaribacillus aureus TaxID=3051825 RepID=A0ABT8L531_9BACT|nr:4-(cytidine 5'-diphospho)-2-C-methyl-D-erythritol kinase [Fulvivirgaceae bacterium BMA12]
MLSFPNAKINLGLNIIEKRKDGFHNLESCFYPVPWHDVLEIVPSQKLSFQITGLEIPGDPMENLCLKAYRLLAEDFDLEPVSIHLHKIIPMGAGLGGGSSDAAATLKLLNQLFTLDLDEETLAGYASEIGSDCAFFIKNAATLAHGKGDQFLKITINLAEKYLVLVYPNIHVNTAVAYSGIIPQKPSHGIAKIIENEPLSSWKDQLTNDFEHGIFKQHPSLTHIKATLYQLGAAYASMSGSGSALFGLFEQMPQLPEEFDNYLVWKGQLS